MTREEPIKNHPRSLGYAQVPLADLHSPQRLAQEYDQGSDSSYYQSKKRKRTKMYLHSRYPMGNCSLYWSKTMGFLSYLQDQEDLHIRRDTILMPNVSTIKGLEGIQRKIASPSRIRSNPWSTQIRSNSENWSVVIRSIKIKGSTRGSFCLLFDHECFHLRMHFLKNVNFTLMSAFAWNE